MMPWRRPPGLMQRLGRFALGQGAALAALAVVAAGLLGFAAVMQLVEGGSHRFDEAVLLALRRPGLPDQPIGPHWLTLSAREVTALGSIPVLALLGLLALGYLMLDGRWRAVLLLAVSLPGGLLLNSLLKQGFDRPRPELVARLAEVQTASFPSGHAMLSAIGFLTLGALLASGRPAAAAPGLYPGDGGGADPAGGRQPGLARGALADRRAGGVVPRRRLGDGVLADAARLARSGRRRRS